MSNTDNQISLEIHGPLENGGTIDVSVLADEELVRKVMNNLLLYGFSAAPDASRHHESAQQEKLREVIKAAEAYRDLATCYRLGKRPSDKLFNRLDKANALLDTLIEQPTEGNGDEND